MFSDGDGEAQAKVVIHTCSARKIKLIMCIRSNKDILDGFKEIGMQNVNECLNNTVWSLCSKVIYTFIYNIDINNIIIYYYLYKIRISAQYKAGGS